MHAHLGTSFVTQRIRDIVTFPKSGFALKREVGVVCQFLRSVHVESSISTTIVILSTFIVHSDLIQLIYDFWVTIRVLQLLLHGGDLIP